MEEKRAGQIALTPFAYTDLNNAKLRPVLLLRKASARFDDWLVCMISSQLHQAEHDLDEFVLPDQPDFITSGLKVPSVVRLSRLAVADGSLMLGSIGWLSAERLHALRLRLAAWICR